MTAAAKKLYPNITFDFPRIGGQPLDAFKDLLIVSFPVLAHELTTSGVYDIVKYSVLSVLNKLKKAKNKNVHLPTVVLKFEDKTVELAYNFELSEEQKQAVVDKTLRIAEKLANQKANKDI